MVDVGTAIIVSAIIGSSAGSVTYLIKDIVQNKIAAGYLEASDEVNLGDTIEINGEKGKVAEFADRNVYLLVEPEDGESYIYEEEVFEVLKNPVKNYSLAEEMD